uniref:Pco123869 n=1 Tax=Arundo donax TaxID=35708 RepID=A0A0A9DQ45_ARUDO
MLFLVLPSKTLPDVGTCVSSLPGMLVQRYKRY